jgi:hypothetical protein
MVIPVTTRMLRDLANKVVIRRQAKDSNKERRDLDGHLISVEKNWADRFIIRRPELKKLLARGLKLKRAIQTKPEIVYDFIDKLCWIIAIYNIRLENVCNINEKRCGLEGVID